MYQNDGRCWQQGARSSLEVVNIDILLWLMLAARKILGVTVRPGTKDKLATVSAV